MEDCMATSTLASTFTTQLPQTGVFEETKQHGPEPAIPAPHTRIPGLADEPTIESIPALLNRIEGLVEETPVPAEPVRDDSEIMEVWRQFKIDPDRQDLRNRLVERYMPLVRYNGERIWARLPEGVELDDLVSAGIFGLMDAIEAFDLTRGVKFETYCVPRIRGAMLDELRTMDWVPRLVRSKASKLQEATKTLETRLGRHPTGPELATHMSLNLADLEKMMVEASAVNLISLNKKWYETDSYKDVREIDILEDKKGEDPTRRIQKNDLMRLVTKGLNRNERLIIILYYYEELTMKEIGATLDLSESRVSQMHSSIVQRLQHQLGRRRPEFGM
jgi:RNA polymerase sigma factor for flagellar operon FliA